MDGKRTGLKYGQMCFNVLVVHLAHYLATAGWLRMSNTNKIQGQEKRHKHAVLNIKVCFIYNCRTRHLKSWSSSHCFEPLYLTFMVVVLFCVFFCSVTIFVTILNS